MKNANFIQCCATTSTKTKLFLSKNLFLCINVFFHYRRSIWIKWISMEYFFYLFAGHSHRVISIATVHFHLQFSQQQKILCSLWIKFNFTVRDSAVHVMFSQFSRCILSEVTMMSPSIIGFFRFSMRSASEIQKYKLKLNEFHELQWQRRMGIPNDKKSFVYEQRFFYTSKMLILTGWIRM